MKKQARPTAAVPKRATGQTHGQDGHWRAQGRTGRLQACWAEGKEARRRGGTWVQQGSSGSAPAREDGSV